MTVRQHDALAFLLLLIAVVCTYQAAILADYGFRDDYVFLSRAERGDPYDESLLVLGRPLLSLLYYLVFPSVHQVENLKIVRGFCILLIAVLAWCLYRAFRRGGWPWIPCLAGSYLLCCLPSFQVYASWTACGLYPLGMLIACLAWRLAQRAVSRNADGFSWIRAALAALLLLISLTLYQPAGMYFFVFMAIGSFRPEDENRPLLRPFLQVSAIVLAGFLLALATFKMGEILSPPDHDLGARVELFNDVPGKIMWFLQEPLTKALNLVSIPHATLPAFPVAALICVGLLSYFRGGWRRRLAAFGMAMVLIPLAHAPSLVTSENWASYRSEGALTSLVALYALFALRGGARLLGPRAAGPVLGTVLVLAAAASGLMASRQVKTLFVDLQANEYMLMRSQLVGQDLDRAAMVFAVNSRWTDNPAPFCLYDEFGIATSVEAVYTRAMVDLMFRELAPDREDIPIIILSGEYLLVMDTYLESGNPIPPHVVVVDMRKLRSLGPDTS